MEKTKLPEVSWQEYARERIIDSIIPIDRHWVKGDVDDYRFQAKVYDVGSKYGINGGRVSKLWLVRDNRSDGQDGFVLIANYDRGWDVRPKGKKDTEIYEIILGCLEAMPEFDD